MRRDDAWIALAAVLAAVHFGSFPLREHPLVTDVRHFLYFAQQTAKGALPHLDLFDNKTQLATFTGAALFRLGAALGLDPLLAVRGGYLGLAAITATLAFVVQRRLGGGRAMCGMLGLASQCAFWLLGLLPAIGNVPKLQMAALASVTALCAARGAWFAAGVAGALAALDWQIGALALVGAAVAALGDERSGRRRALVRLALGAAVPCLVLLAVYAGHGGVGALVRQTVVASFFRGAAAQGQRTLGAEVLRRWQVVTTGCGHEVWLLAVALAGAALYARRMRAVPADRPATRLAVTLGVHHYGVLAFSLWDFQLYGDLFVLLHTMSFFAAVAAGDLYVRATASPSTRRRALVSVLALAAAIAVARPWVARGTLRLGLPASPHPLTLDDQKQLAARIAPLLADGRTAVLAASEQLVLSGRRNPVPFVYWNAAAWTYYRRPGEARPATLRRMLDGAGVERVVCDPGYPACAELPGYALETTVAAGGFAVEVHARTGAAGLTVPGSRAP